MAFKIGWRAATASSNRANFRSNFYEVAPPCSKLAVEAAAR
jgi:hypothetical protein